MKVPITQSEAWHKLQNDLGEKSHLLTGKEYQSLAIDKHTPAGNYLYCPYGPIATSEESFKQAIKDLESQGRKSNAIFIRVEPFKADQAKLLPKNSIKTKDLNPRETWLLDLTGTDEELKQKLPSRLLRYYKSASKKGIAIEKSHNSSDIHYLLDLQRALAKEKGISTFSEHYLATELKQPFATLYLVWHDPTVAATEGDTKAFDGSGRDHPLSVSEVGKELIRQNPPRKSLIAAGLVFDDDDTRYNLQGAQSDEGRKLHATGILTIELIKDAKAAGKKTFDFWGIAPEGAPATHPWAGFTNFKKTFAGYQFNHAGTYDIVLKPAKYKLYQSLRKIRRLV